MNSALSDRTLAVDGHQPSMLDATYRHLLPDALDRPHGAGHVRGKH
jgi:hypothetical protein